MQASSPNVGVGVGAGVGVGVAVGGMGVAVAIAPVPPEVGVAVAMGAVAVGVGVAPLEQADITTARVSTTANERATLTATSELAPPTLNQPAIATS